MTSSSYTDMIKIVYDHVLPEMEANEIPDTTLNRILFLEGLLEAWAEDLKERQEAKPWGTAVHIELLILRSKQITERFQVE